MSDTTETPKAEAPKPDYSALYAALATAQGAFPTIPRDKTVKVTMKSGGTYTFAYAPLDTILAAVRPHLSANGLAVMQTMENDHVFTIITHASGVQIKLAPVKVLQTESGPQALGSALTYARRYSVTLALNLAADEDDDANGAQGNKAEKQDRGRVHQPAKPAAHGQGEPIVDRSPASDGEGVTEGMKKTIKASLEKKDVDEGRLLRAFKVESMDQLKKAAINDILAWINGEGQS